MSHLLGFGSRKLFQRQMFKPGECCPLPLPLRMCCCIWRIAGKDAVVPPYFILEVVSFLRWESDLRLPECYWMDLILQVAGHSLTINFISSWDRSGLWSQIMQSLLGTFLEEGRCCKASKLFALFNSVRGKWSEQGVGKGLNRKGKAPWLRIGKTNLSFL